ncbi:MAG: hypothetical protein LIP01_08270 [Tannerellaceae bacterium]|nr:hypothetical protein [Tannerellaceae bacterium]
MKYKYTTYILMVFTFTLVALTAVPELVKKATYTPYRYTFMYYSSQLEELCFLEYSNKEQPLVDRRGTVILRLKLIR